MKISIISVFPEIHETFLSHGIIAKAVANNKVTFNLIKLSSLLPPKVRIDEPTCGPGAGMVIKPTLLEKAIEQCEEEHGPGIRIFFSPQGVTLNQQVLTNFVQEVSLCNKPSFEQSEGCSKKQPHLIIVCPRYEGTDERVEQEYADYIFSIGDYVLMGGDIPAQVFIESVLRLIPGIIGNQESVEHDSFSGPFLDHPLYGLPIEWKNKKVPEVLTSGNHGAIKDWRNEQAIKKTIHNRFDWFRKKQPSIEQIQSAKNHIPNHYLTLMHSQVLIKGKGVGHTSIASLDIHDIARTSKTFDITQFFLVSELIDQRNILESFLKFWHSRDGEKYNQSRYDAVALVNAQENLTGVIQHIEEKEGVKPIIIATSAKNQTNAEVIDYYSQGKVWQQNRPVLFLFGTGQGLADEVLNECDYILAPVEGMSGYNHLSVRAAVAIILDRWLGLQPQFPQTRIKEAE